MRSKFFNLAVMAVLTGAAAFTAVAQTASPITVRTDAEIRAKLKTLMAKSKTTPEGMANEILDKYPGHYTMAIARSKDGGSEVHATLNDFFFIEEGEGVIVTGGTVVNPKNTGPGEIRGTGLTGATTSHTVHKGDIIHVEAGVPHWTKVPTGTLTYFVVKVESKK